MGQAKRRGTKEQREKEAIERKAQDVARPKFNIKSRKISANASVLQSLMMLTMPLHEKENE